MCGIAGFTGKGGHDVLERMTGRLEHRGPDDVGTYHDENIALGFRRLSVIDLQGGRQPLSGCRGGLRVVFNGEIYNFRELRKELEGKHRFVTDSDSEVIVHLFEELGPGAFERLDGMFAIAVWDQEGSELILARDRFGKKPLYITERGGELAFASEIKALFELPSLSKIIDPVALQGYLEKGYIGDERTIFSSVKKISPGTYVSWVRGRLRTFKYWTLPQSRSEPLTESEAIARFEGLFSSAVKKRLMADVPVGVFLSGGVDSSLVAAFASDRSKTKLKSFSIGFEDDEFDESTYAAEVARIIGTEHYERRFSGKEVLERFDAAVEMLDEPFADPSFIPTQLLSEFARKEVTVALSGDGADEVFLGYDSFKAQRVAGWFNRLPSVVRAAAKALAERLPPDDRHMSFSFVARRFTSTVGLPEDERDLAWRRKISEVDLDDVFPGGKPNASKGGATPRERFRDAYLLDWLPDDILYKLDRASMAASLEVRSPFLDTDVVRFSRTLPDELLLNGLTTKYLLKRVLEKRLPRRLVRRKKRGFAIPVAAWLRGPLRDRCDEVFGRAFQRRMGLLDGDAVSGWWKDHVHRRRDRRQELWTVLMLSEWWKRWME